MSKKMNWTEGAGLTNKKDPIWNGGPATGETGGQTPTDVPNHLKADTTLQSYITEIASDYQKEYDDMYDDKYHNGNCYPSLGSKTKGGMD